MSLKSAWSVLKQTISDWSDDNAMTLSAALAFYAIFSMAPLLVIAIYIAGAVFGEASTKEQVLEQLQAQLGPAASETIGVAIEHTQKSAGKRALVLSIIAAAYGALGVFAQLQISLNIVWDAPSRPGKGILRWLWKRLLSFFMVLAIGGLLLASMVLTAAISGLRGTIEEYLPGSWIVWQVVNQVVTLGLVILLFAMIFKILPDVSLPWRQVWLGAAITALLFTVGKLLIGLYLGYSSVRSTYGAAGSLAVLLVWVYYSSMIFFLGAEFIHVRARARGWKPEPEPEPRA